jgi:hypothetical protein
MAMAMTRGLLGLVAIAVVATLWVVNCSGPRPAVAVVQLVAPGADGEPYLVAATIRNQGWGHGEARVTVRLRDRASGQTIQREETVALDTGETTRLTAELRAPPGDYAVEVDAEYPPR